MRPIFFVALLASATAFSHSARAADASVETPAEMRADLLTYYGAERTAAIVIGSLSAVAVAGGTLMLRGESNFQRGFGWPLVTLGALEIVGAVAYVFQVNSEIDRYSALLRSDPSAYRAQESTHMQGTSDRFVYYRLVELGLTVGGLGAAAYGFAAHDDAWKGAGLGCAAIGLPIAIIDTFNNARAQWYRDRVSHFDATVGLGRTEGGLTIQLSSRF